MYKRKTKLSPIHISLIALAILVVIAVIVTFAVKKDEPKEPVAALSMTILPLKAVGRRSRRRKSSSASTTRCRRA